MLYRIDDRAAGPEQWDRAFVAIDPAEPRVAGQKADRRRALLQKHPNALVVILGRAKANQLTLGLCAAAMHCVVDTAGIGRLAGHAEVFLIPVFRPIQRRVERTHFNTRAVYHLASLCCPVK